MPHYRLAFLGFGNVGRALARHYGFTIEELDFIINYDIKYRMGGIAEDAEAAQ